MGYSGQKSVTAGKCGGKGNSERIPTASQGILGPIGHTLPTILTRRSCDQIGTWGPGDDQLQGLPSDAGRTRSDKEVLGGE
jgi:hypothetical protein